MKNSSFSRKIISLALAAVIGWSGAPSMFAAGSQGVNPSFSSRMFSRLAPNPILCGLGITNRFLSKPIIKQATTGGLNDYVEAPTQEKIKNKTKAVISQNYGNFKFWNAKFWASPGIRNGLFLGTWSALGGTMLKMPYIGLGIPFIGFIPGLIASRMPQYKENDKDGNKKTGMIPWVHSKINWNIAIPACLVGGLLAYNYLRGNEGPSLGSCALPVASAIGVEAVKTISSQFLLEEANYLFDIDRRIARTINHTYSCLACEGAGSKENPLLTVCSGNPQHVMHKTCALDSVKDHAYTPAINCPICIAKNAEEPYGMEEKCVAYLRNEIQKQWQEFARTNTKDCSICKQGLGESAQVLAIRDRNDQNTVLFYAHQTCFKAKKPCKIVAVCQPQKDVSFVQEDNNPRVQEDNNDQEIRKPREKHYKNLSTCFDCGKGYKKQDLVNGCSRNSKHLCCIDCLSKAALQKHPKCRCGNALDQSVTATILSAL